MDKCPWCKKISCVPNESTVEADKVTKMVRTACIHCGGPINVHMRLAVKFEDINKGNHKEGDQGEKVKSQINHQKKELRKGSY